MRRKTNPKVTIETKKIGKFLEITIRDNGIGFAPGSKEKLFNMFYREKQETSKELVDCFSTENCHTLNASLSKQMVREKGLRLFLTIPLRLVQNRNDENIPKRLLINMYVLSLLAFSASGQVCTR